jgi:uncharacterized protein YqjF (DUF2071 family)
LGRKNPVSSLECPIFRGSWTERNAMSAEQPFLTASWTEMLMLIFAVPGDAIARLAPPGTEPDFFDGQAYISVVGFTFRNARLFGIGFPGHSRFEEVNLRYYVRREIGSTLRRGVVFVREIAPRPLVAATARWIYNESYVTRRMRNSVRLACASLAAGDAIDYEWRTGQGAKRHWNRMAGRAAVVPGLPEPGSLTEFIVEHYWAYVRTRDGGTAEYRVAHRPWRVAPAESVVWNCDLAASYGNTPLAEYLAAPPVLAFVADGSPVQVFRGRRCEESPIQHRRPRSVLHPDLTRPISAE